MNGTQLLCIQLKIAASDYRLEVEFSFLKKREKIYYCDEEKLDFCISPAKKNVLVHFPRIPFDISFTHTSI